MRTKKSITVVGCHAGGEIGNVVVGGVSPPPGATVFEQMRALAADDSLRKLLHDTEPNVRIAAATAVLELKSQGFASRAGQ